MLTLKIKLNFVTTKLSVHVYVLRIVASLEAEASALSSVASSQDSLHKQPKKKGIKSSIGRLFGKKEKGRLAHLAHRQVMVDPQGGHRTRGLEPLSMIYSRNNSYYT